MEESFGERDWRLNDTIVGTFSASSVLVFSPEDTAEARVMVQWSLV